MPSSLRIGRIAYANVLPLYAAFDAGAVEPPGTFVTASPSVLNAMVDAGELDLSPMSVGHYLRRGAIDPDAPIQPPGPIPLGIAKPFCIASREAVQSVLLVSELPPAVLGGRTISATRDSASGRALVELILRGRYEVDAKFVPTDDPLAEARAGHPTLVIGDRALDAANEFPAEHVYDLGTLWWDWTGTPMVYALWVYRRDRDPQSDTRRFTSRERELVMSAFRDAYRWAQANPEAIVEQAMAMKPRDPEIYRDYFRTLKYDLDTQALNGLATFGEKLRAYRVQPEIRSGSC